MYEWSTLFIVAAALYAIECLAWIPATATVLFRGSIGGLWRTARGRDLPGNERGGIAFVDPLGFGGSVLVLHGWPFAMSPSGVTPLERFGPPQAGAEFIRFDDVDHVQTLLGDILINGRRFVRLNSAPVADSFAAHLRRVSALPLSERSAAIEAAIRARFSQSDAAEALKRFRSASRILRGLSIAVFGFTFAAAPLAVAYLGLAKSWLWILVGLFGLSISTVVAFVRLHGALFPLHRSDRWTHALGMLLLPIASARSGDKLSRDVLGIYEAATVAPLVCTKERALPTLRLDWFDLERALREAEVETLTGQCISSFGTLFRNDLARSLDSAGLDVNAPPARESNRVTAYCPRCHAQFELDAPDACPDCVGVLTKRFPGKPIPSRKTVRTS